MVPAGRPGACPEAAVLGPAIILWGVTGALINPNTPVNSKSFIILSVHASSLLGAVFAESLAPPPSFAAGVYHCTDPVPAEPDWGIALRVSKEARGGGGGGGDGDGDGVTNDEKTRRKEAERGLKPGPKAVASVAASAAEAVPEKQGEQVLTPPLLIPLQSGDAYFLLDDFK